MTLQELVGDSSADWKREPPADAVTLAQLGAALPALPREYLAFLALSGGGEGEQ